MRHSIEAFRALGLSPGQYKAVFTDPEPDSNIKRLLEIIRQRVQTAISEKLSEYRVYAAIDFAYELPLASIAAPVIQYIVNRQMSVREAQTMLASFGLDLSKLFIERETADGKKKVEFNPPVFFDVVIPLVKAYSTVRAAKLFADRRRDPLLPYIPLKQVPSDRIQAEIVQDIVHTMSSWWGYETILREAIGQAVKYGVALVFPREVWYREHVLTMKDSEPSLKQFRQGLRYTIPHPTRVFWDQRHPLTTINTDSGVEYVGFWDVWRWGEILDGPYWNKESYIRSRDWFSPAQYKTYFEQAYPCAITLPYYTDLDHTREGRLITYSPTTTRDASIVVTTLYMKIVPAEYGLGDARVPIWHRFIVAGDDTVIWCEPCPYTPAWFVGYDYDPHSAVQSSISLEIMPFQDAIANLLADLILTCKQNLLALVYYDRNAVSERAIKQFEQAGESRYKSITFLSYDGALLPKLGTDIRRAFEVIEFPKRSIAEIINTIGSVINIMERVLQISGVELGVAAPHYQSAEEIRSISAFTSSRLQYVGAHIDDGIEAWKRQLYNALIEYWDDDIIAEITTLGDAEMEAVKELGFEIVTKGERKTLVKGKKSALRIEAFAQPISFESRAKNMQLATTIYQVVQIVASKPEVFAAVGVDNVIRLVEEAAVLSGAPSNFSLRRPAEGANEEDVRSWTLRVVQEAQQALIAQLGDGVIGPVVQRLSEHEQAMAAIAQTLTQVAAAVQQRNQLDGEAMVKLQKAMADIQIKAAKAAADVEIKQRMADMQLKRMQDLHRMELATKLAKVSAELAKQEATEAMLTSAVEGQTTEQMAAQQ